MKLAAAALLLMACTEHGERPHLAVTIASVPGTIKVYRPDPDLCCTAIDPFPDDGTCVHATDAASCGDCSLHPSCFTSFDLEDEAGSLLGSLSPGMSNVITFLVPLDGRHLTVIARGCGDDVRIPIPTGGPSATFTQSAVTNGIDVSWPPDPARAGAIVSSGTESCRTSASSHHFDVTDGDIRLFEFATPKVVESPAVTFTVYFGSVIGGSL